MPPREIPEGSAVGVNRHATGWVIDEFDPPRIISGTTRARLDRFFREVAVSGAGGAASIDYITSNPFQVEETMTPLRAKKIKKERHLTKSERAMVHKPPKDKVKLVDLECEDLV